MPGTRDRTWSHMTLWHNVHAQHSARDRKRNNGRLQGIRKQCSKWILGNVSAEAGYLVVIKKAYKNSWLLKNTELIISFSCGVLFILLEYIHIGLLHWHRRITNKLLHTSRNYMNHEWILMIQYLYSMYSCMQWDVMVGKPSLRNWVQQSLKSL